MLSIIPKDIELCGGSSGCRLFIKTTAAKTLYATKIAESVTDLKSWLQISLNITVANLEAFFKK